MDSRARADSPPQWTIAAVNAALLTAALALGAVAFFASLDLVLLLGAQVIAGSYANEIRANYALATLRNLWLLFSGALMLIFVIGTLDCFFKRWRLARTRVALLRILAVEAAVIGLWAVLG